MHRKSRMPGWSTEARSLSDAELVEISAGKIDYSEWDLEQLKAIERAYLEQVNDALDNPDDYGDSRQMAGAFGTALLQIRAELARREKAGTPPG